MKEVLTVKLERQDIVDAIDNYLHDKGYKVEDIKFQYGSGLFSSQLSTLTGANVVVTKKEENHESITRN